MHPPVYLDYAATTPVDPRVAEVMGRYLTRDGIFGNAASGGHAFGAAAAKAIETARGQVAELVGADPREIIWTSGATESDNLALKGAARYYRKRGRHIVTCKTEHKAVLDPCRRLQQDGFEVTYLDPRPDGLVDLAVLESVLRKDTILVSIMHVNNEIGVIQDLASIGRLTRDRGVLLHVDAAQSAGKVPIDVKSLEVDLMSFSAHKIYGPKGIGALYVRRRPRVRLEPQIDGGGQERGLRPGTLATHQIAGMGEAFRIARAEMAVENDRILGLRHRLWHGFQRLDEVYLNGHPDRRVAGILNASFRYVGGESLRMALRDLAVSSGSACASAMDEPSHVLSAIRLAPELAGSAVRFSVGRFTTRDEVDFATDIVVAGVARLRHLSPLWESYRRGLESSQTESTMP
jgi:cysteine desulfurase